MSMTKYKVAVHKSIPLAAGETLSQFTNLVRKGGSAYVVQQLSLASKNSNVYIVEVMAAAAVFEVYENKPAGSSYAFYALKYTRDKTGVFSFSSLTEVERVTSFRPKQSLVAKSLGGEAWCLPSSLFAGIV